MALHCRLSTTKYPRFRDHQAFVAARFTRFLSNPLLHASPCRTGRRLLDHHLAPAALQVSNGARTGNVTAVFLTFLENSVANNYSALAAGVADAYSRDPGTYCTARVVLLTGFPAGATTAVASAVHGTRMYMRMLPHASPSIHPSVQWTFDTWTSVTL
jgi:hypothetical protein